jgi:hypothetical protein
MQAILETARAHERAVRNDLRASARALASLDGALCERAGAGLLAELARARELGRGARALALARLHAASVKRRALERLAERKAARLRIRES